MPKYIERDNLPQFKYYNFCEGKLDSWGLVPAPHAEYHLNNSGMSMSYTGGINYNYIMIPQFDLDAIYDNRKDVTWEDVRDDWVKAVKNKKGERYQLLEYLYIAINSIHKDRFLADKWRERLQQSLDAIVKGTRDDILVLLHLIDDYISVLRILRACQGFPFFDGINDVYPKMLLIESEFYKKQKDSARLELDYNLIKKGLRDTCYVITINGDNAEKRMCFFLYDMDDSIALSMIDHNNGRTLFAMKRTDAYDTKDAVEKYNSTHDSKIIGDTLLMALKYRCHPRGDYDCRGNFCIYCDGINNCKHKMLNIASAVLYSFQEYIRKTNNVNADDSNGTGTDSSDKKKAKPFIPNGMIRMYDIKYSADELKSINKFKRFGKGGTEYTSSEKVPHVRRGTMRFNPKTGQKDIAVRGSIIHKDKYQGFSTAERIKE